MHVSAQMLALMCSFTAVAASPSNLDEVWSAWRSEHGKSYGSAALEAQKRAVFARNVERFAVRSRHDTATYGADEHADLTVEEFVAVRAGCFSDEGFDHIPKAGAALAAEAPPAVDWRTAALNPAKVVGVTKVKNQGAYGYCWAFGASGCLEGMNAIQQKNPLVELSEQEFIDCCTDVVPTPAQSCWGHGPQATWNFLLNYTHGTDSTEASYPYNLHARKGNNNMTCALKNRGGSGVTVNGTKIVQSKAKIGSYVSANTDKTTGNQDLILAALVKYGPGNIGVDATCLFGYKKGIISNCTGKSVDHATLLVGAGSAPGLLASDGSGAAMPYWIVKNSWGPAYGEGGYYRMERNHRQCDFTGAAFPIAAADAEIGGGGRPLKTSDDFAFSVGFTDDVVLQQAPAAAAVYGLSAAGDTVTVTVTNDAAAETYTATAAPVAKGGTADPLCQRRCLAAGHCATGQISACQKPSCAMGCIISGRVKNAAACKASCAAAADPKSGCVFTVVSSAGRWHEPGITTANQTLQMCDNGPVLTNGTQCSSCSGPDRTNRSECEQGCDFGAPVGAAPVAWKALLKPAKAGGSYTLTATSIKTGAKIVLRRATFGNVFFCSGQSNMDLALQYTFSKPRLDKDIKAGKYSNIRLFQYGDMGVKYEELVPTYATTQGTLQDPTDSGGTWGNLTTASKPIHHDPPNPQSPLAASYNLLGQFSATCFYFAVGLVDQGDSTPIGLIQSAIGGSQIEAWTPDTALGKCKNESLNADGQAPPGRLYNGMVAPFVNTSVAGYLWYQGENNCGGTMGNSKTGYGYGCQLPAMIAEWRRLWSATAGTTAKLPPFGVITLAAGGSEGHDYNMAGMRWSETANYGALPNAAIENGFLAHAYDLGDPMDNLHAPCVNSSDHNKVNTSAFAPGGPCTWPPASAWNKAVAPLREVVFANAAPSFMGGIHPRFKHEVGRRLALAYNGVSSATIAGCTMAAKKIAIRFDAKLLGSDTLSLQWKPEDYNMSAWGVQDSSSLMVCVGKPSANAPPSAADCLADFSLWKAAPLSLPAQKTAGGSAAAAPSLEVDLSGLAGQVPVAVRYGWPLSTGADTCCPFTSVKSGKRPCIPGSCPIITAKNSLPANPWYANLVGGKCACMAPQTCSS